MINVAVVVGSTRPNRKAEVVARWVLEIAKRRTDASYELVDIKDYELPLLDEPVPPSMGKYSKDHTKRWAAKIASFDAFVFVTPEYNYSTPPALLNALDYLSAEWAYKPAGFVSYGGVSGGLRAVQMTKQTLTALRMMPIVEAVNIPFVAKLMEAGAFKATDVHDKSAAAMLDELIRWAAALRPLRS